MYSLKLIKIEKDKSNWHAGKDYSLIQVITVGVDVKSQRRYKIL